MARKKITIVGGAGNVGATIAAYASAEELGDIVMVDLLEGVTMGKALDMLEATPNLGVTSRIVGAKEYEATADSDVIVLTAGIPRKPGMSRDDLLSTNVKIVGEVAEKAAKLSPNAIMIVVSNPLDAMVYVAWKKSGFNPRKVMGMSGILNTARFRTFVAEEINVSPEFIQALVLGGHGDTLVPVVQYCTVGGVPITKLIDRERLNQIVQRTRDGGAEIVSLLETGSAFYAPAAATLVMLKSILRDKNGLIPCAAYLDGEYGEMGIFVGVPVILGAEGVVKVIEVDLNEEDQTAFARSVAAVKQLVAKVNEMLQ